MKPGDWVEYIGSEKGRANNNPNIGRIVKLLEFVGERPITPGKKQIPGEDWWRFGHDPGMVNRKSGASVPVGAPLPKHSRYLRACHVRVIEGGARERKALRVAYKLLHE